MPGFAATALEFEAAVLALVAKDFVLVTADFVLAAGFALATARVLTFGFFALGFFAREFCVLGFVPAPGFLSSANLFCSLDIIGTQAPDASMIQTLQ